MLAKLATTGTAVLLIFAAGALFGIGVDRYLSSPKNTAIVSGGDSHAELPVDSPQPPRDPVLPREPPASNQAQVPASETRAEANGEQQAGARRRQHPSGTPSDELDGSTLVLALQQALKEYTAPTENEFKRQKATEKYLATLRSYRDRRVRLRLKVARVKTALVEVGALPLGFSDAVEIDFSGIDFGDSWYKDSRPVIRFEGPGPNWLAPAEPVPLRNLIPSNKIAAPVLHNLEKGADLYVQGRIVSLTSLVPRNQENRLILSLKIEQISVGPDESRPPLARTPPTPKRAPNHSLYFLFDVLETRRLGGVNTEEALADIAEVPIIRNCCRRIWKTQTVDTHTIQQVADWLAEKKGLSLEKVWALPLKEVAIALQEEARKH